MARRVTVGGEESLEWVECIVREERKDGEGWFWGEGVSIGEKYLEMTLFWERKKDEDAEGSELGMPRGQL